MTTLLSKLKTAKNYRILFGSGIITEEDPRITREVDMKKIKTKSGHPP